MQRQAEITAREILQVDAILLEKWSVESEKEAHLSAVGGHLSFTRNIGTVAMDVSAVETVTFEARGGVDLVNVHDLTGTGVGKVVVDLEGAPGSGTEANFRQLSAVYGFKKEDISPQYLSFSESAEQFKDKHIDAFMRAPGSRACSRWRRATVATESRAWKPSRFPISRLATDRSRLMARVEA